ncbi:MAG: hypothetical protein EKK55_07070 [Rhodocyclaceae bacterium]|nr:MAG: hypothetical protein EKK55_07070 [Rhodocyclaceae bacterium]
MGPVKHRLLEQLDEEARVRAEGGAQRAAATAKAVRTGRAEALPKEPEAEGATLPFVIPAVRDAAVAGATSIDVVVDAVLGRDEPRAAAAESEAARMKEEVSRVQGIVRDAEAALATASAELSRVMSIEGVAAGRAKTLRTAVAAGHAAAMKLPADVVERLRSLDDAWPA